MSTVIDPILIPDAAIFTDGQWKIPIRGIYRPLRENGGPIVAAFMTGWRAQTLFNGFACYPILQLCSETEFGMRILNTEGRFLGDCIQQMGPVDAQRFRKQVLHILGPLFRSLLFDARPALSPAAGALLQLSPTVTFRIAQIVQQELVADPLTLAAQDLPEILTINSCQDERPIPIHPLRIERALALDDFQARIAQASDGVMHWPSPVDGAPVAAQGSLCFSDMAIGYRFHDFRHGITFFLFAADECARPVGLYLPQLDLFVPRGRGYVRWAAGTMACNISPSLIHLVCRHGLDLIPYLARGATRTVNLMRSPPWTHMAHQLWNEMGGMQQHVELAPRGARVPETIAPCGGVGMELYGPVDVLFPEWSGRVRRDLPDPDAAIRSSYRSDACVVRITSHYVSARLRDRLRRHALSTCTCLGQIRSFQAMQRDTKTRKPIIMIGLRVENRTHEDLGGLLVRLLTRIAQYHPGAIAILDGHNTRVGAGGNMIESHGESVALEHPARVERRLVLQLRQQLAAADLCIIDTIGRPMSDSLALATASDCFFAIWGACLAKFRWVANKPGVALTSRDNILHRPDLAIYHTAANMEAPTEMVIPDPAWVHDLPDAPVLMNPGPGQPRFFNFRIEEEPVFGAMLDIVGRVMATAIDQA